MCSTTNMVSTMFCYFVAVVSPWTRRYLQEFAAMGTAGGIYHFRDQILSGGPSAFFLMNADVCSEFPLLEMLRFHGNHGDAHCGVLLGTTVSGPASSLMQYTS